MISPWNFPASICAGMTVAALATGNTAVVKPSTQTRGADYLLNFVGPRCCTENTMRHGFAPGLE